MKPFQPRRTTKPKCESGTCSSPKSFEGATLFVFCSDTCPKCKKLSKELDAPSKELKAALVGIDLQVRSVDEDDRWKTWGKYLGSKKLPLVFLIMNDKVIRKSSEVASARQIIALIS